MLEPMSLALVAYDYNRWSIARVLTWNRYCSKVFNELFVAVITMVRQSVPFRGSKSTNMPFLLNAVIFGNVVCNKNNKFNV